MLCALSANSAHMSHSTIPAKNGGWFAKHKATGTWLKLEPEPKTETRPDMKSQFRDVPLMPILSAILDATGPADLAATLAEIARERAQREPTTRRDRDFWLVVRCHGSGRRWPRISRAIERFG